MSAHQQFFVEESTLKKTDVKNARRKTLLELSGQCGSLQDVIDKYVANLDCNVGDVFVFGHKQCKVYAAFWSKISHTLQYCYDDD